MHVFPFHYQLHVAATQRSPKLLCGCHFARHAELKDGLGKAGLKEIPPDLAAIMDGAGLVAP